MSQYKEQIAQGVALLDRVRPDWRDRINVNRLDLMSNSDCVLGQVFGHYRDGMKALGLSDDTLTGTLNERGAPYGFAVAFNGDIYDNDDIAADAENWLQLSREWREELAN